MLKSQGPENWPRGRPGPPLGASNSRSVRDTSFGKNPGGKRWWGGVAWRRRSGVLGTRGILFSFVNGGEGPATVPRYIKWVYFGKKRPRSRGEPSPLAGRCLPSAPGAGQQPGVSAGSCSVCSSAARGSAAGPGSRIGNHRRRLGWEGAAWSGGDGAGFLLRRFAGAASAGAVSSGGVSSRIG